VALERLADPADPRVMAYRGLSDAALLSSAGLFMAEGRLVVRRVLETERFRVRSLLLNHAAFQSLQPLLAHLDDRVPVFVCEASTFQPITGHHIHRGCLALVERPDSLQLDTLLASIGERSAASRSPIAPHVPQSAKRTVLIALEAVSNPDNVGGVFRNAAAFAAAAVLLGPGCCDPFYRKAIRTSMAATLQVPHAAIDDWPHAFGRLRAHGFTIAALSPREPAVSLDSFASRAPRTVALLVGAEGNGLSPDVELAADVRVRIPISREVDSLNLSVAAGIALHRLSSELA
jgi:tRNA G18 (ribose-2'-O)-methylase SpoU